MVAATFFFLGLSVCIAAGLVCYVLARFFWQPDPIRVNPEITESERALWLQLKAALMELYSRYEVKETPKQRALRSWAGTLVICAGLCMIGVLLEVEFNRHISIDEVIAGFLGPQHVSVPANLPRAHHASAQPADATQQPSETAH